MSVYHSKNRKGRHKIDLLCLQTKKKQSLMFDKKSPHLRQFLFRSKLDHEKGPETRSCRSCFQPIVQPNFKKRYFCENNAPLEIPMLNESPSVGFVSGENAQKCPSVVYAEFEATNVASTQIPKVKSRTREIDLRASDVLLLADIFEKFRSV